MVKKNLKIKHKMTNELLKISDSNDFFEALGEFDEVTVETFKKGECKDLRRCLCHGVLRRKMYIIQHRRTGIRVFVGKKCYKMFRLRDLELSEKIKIMKIKPNVKGIVDFNLIQNMAIADEYTGRALERYEYTNTCNKVINKIGSEMFTFGRYKGKSVYSVVEQNKHYIAFILSDRFKRKPIFDQSEYLFVD